MKTPEEIAIWCDMMLNHHPNIEDINFFNSIKDYMKKERPQGEWIEKVERRGCFAGDKTVYSYTCPFCGVKEFKKYPFCHCGAKMKKGEEG